MNSVIPITPVCTPFLIQFSPSLIQLVLHYVSRSWRSDHDRIPQAVNQQSQSEVRINNIIRGCQCNCMSTPKYIYTLNWNCFYLFISHRLQILAILRNVTNVISASVKSWRLLLWLHCYPHAPCGLITVTQ